MTQLWRNPIPLLLSAVCCTLLIGASAEHGARAQDATGTQQDPAAATEGNGNAAEDAAVEKKLRKNRDKADKVRNGENKRNRGNEAGTEGTDAKAPPAALPQNTQQSAPAKSEQPPAAPVQADSPPPPPAKSAEPRAPKPAQEPSAAAAPATPPATAAPAPPPASSEPVTAPPAQPPPNKMTRKPQPLPEASSSGAAPPPQPNAPAAAAEPKYRSRNGNAIRDARGPRNIEEMRARRTERKEDGGKRVIIQEPDNRTVVRQDGKLVIQKDETLGLKRVAPNARTTQNPSGITTTVVDRPNGSKVITETDKNGQLIRRYRRGPGGRETVIIDNRRRKGISGRDIAIGVGIAAGAAILNSVVNVPPPRVRVPRDKYVVDYDRASEEDVYEALNAPPVDEFDGYYTLNQVRATRYLRERMRRVDLDDINFETGSWDVDPSQYRKLERIARAMRRIIRRNPEEVFLVEGYTDAVGSDVDNIVLSDRRAESVSAILTEEFNVPFENLTTQGYGEQFLKIETNGPERANRRVAVRRITPLLAGMRRNRGRDDYDERDDDGRDDDGRDDGGRYDRRRDRDIDE